jgi:two-component system NtrC family sensor kinase
MEREAKRLRLRGIFVKPFDPAQLLQRVESALGSAGTAEEPGAERRRSSLKSEGHNGQISGLEALAQIANAITAMLDLDDVLKAIVEAAVRITGAEESSLLLLDEETGQLTMRASWNFDEEFARTLSLPVQDSLAGQAILSGQPVKIDQDTPQKIKTSYLVHSLLYCPLQARGRRIGVLGVDNRTPGKVITEEDTRILRVIADYAAVAIDNAQMYEHSETERSKLETILTQVGNEVIVVDFDQRILLINRAAQETFGTEVESIGLQAAEVLKNSDLIELIEAPGEAPRREEFGLPDKRIFDAQRTLIEGVGYAIVMQDITHLKELDRIKSEFVTAVSHDLRSPLTAILGYVELIAKAGEVNALQNEFIQKVQSSVVKITTLIDDLLDLGRIEAGLDSEREQIYLADLVREVAIGFNSTVAEKGLAIELDVAKGGSAMLGDKVRLRQMIGNLLDNAIKYSSEGDTISLKTWVEGDQIIFSIQDTGPGIPPADQPYLFDKFFRASNVPEDLPGTGLGLSIVKSIVERHNGRIWADSRLGEGTTFSVVFPAEQS